MKRLSSIRSAAIVIAAVALIATACSSDSSDSTDEVVAAESTEATAASDSNEVSSAIVVEIQTTLTALGYDTGAIDGIYGPHTTGALEAFQKDAGITVDGKYGPETHRAMEDAAIDQGYDWDKHAAIEELQNELADLGFYSGNIDGEYGPQTTDAVKDQTHTPASSTSAEMRDALLLRFENRFQPSRDLNVSTKGALTRW